MPSIIQVTNLSKSYIISHQNRDNYTTLRDVITRSTKSLFSKSVKKKTITKEEFWALNNINFELSKGERVGIIGRNGAGKSTLLKILSRITEPTRGSIKIRGRVASLLEVGTGFHPELSGRENIFLNGAILGMSREEIKKHFDAIVDFAEIDKFLDTPVKRYSSGMYVRLAFAVAAHLEPEILVVDEVLAVGDAQFQKKCLGKMEEVSINEGRTVLFVSHNMVAMQKICNRIIYLENGILKMEGSGEEVISAYLKNSNTNSGNLSYRTDRSGSAKIKFSSVEFLDENGKSTQSLQAGKNGSIKIHFIRRNGEGIKNLQFAVGVNDDLGQRITTFSNHVSGHPFKDVNHNAVQVDICNLPLAKGHYPLVLYSSIDNEVADWIQDAAILEVEAGDFFNTGWLPLEGQGVMYITHSFQLK